MVLQIKGPEEFILNLWKIDSLLPKRYGVRKVSFKKYIPGPKGASYLQISQNTLCYRLSLNREAHGIILNGKLHIHPDSMLALLKKKFQASIKKALHEKLD